ncbi:MAG: multiheme c-type cytochrome [Longimicrobiales bacterium]|nr:multiheme c-type cytochrome [Longimicrobiales bacterium]
MSQSAPDREREWQKWLLAWATAFLVFETITGLAILFLPFSVGNQVTVLVHTLVGVVLMVPYAVYQFRHWRVYREARLTHVKLTGWFSLAAAVVAIVSGLVLTAQAMFGTRISYVWDTIHIVATFGVLAAVAPHVLALVVRNRVGATELAARVRSAERRMGLRTLGLTVALSVPIALGAGLYSAPELMNELPEDYSFLYGEDRPFAPSLARTATGGAFDSRSMGGSRSCGTSGCHEQILAEWEVSAHRYSAADPGFRAVQSAMGKQNGPESTRYCAGCHDPISLFAGTKNLFVDELTNPTGMEEGVSCIVCHSIEETDVQGNADYAVAQPPRYLYELRPEGARRLVRDFLIRAYPDAHVETLSKRMFKTPEYCAACHKQYIDEEINQVGWVQLQNQFDNWRKSRWNEPGDPTKTIECRECHMPLVESDDPAAGDPLDYNRSPEDGRHRSHRFLGANQFVPLLLDLPGAEEHVAMVEQWLRGEIEIPEIRHKWRPGPAVPLELIVPERAAPGEEIRIRTHITNNKVGHDFPTGPLDIIQAWVHVAVRDDNGALVFESGRLDDEHFIEPGSFIFKAEPVDRYGNLIDRHNLWEMVGVRYRRAMFPGFSDEASFTFPAPADGGALHVEARVLYRKFDQSILNFLTGEDSGLTSPVTVISEDSAVIRLAGARAAGQPAGSP